MRLRVKWIVSVWIVIIALAILSRFPDLGLFCDFSEAMLFFIPSVLAFASGVIIVNSFSNRNPERKTWFLFTLGAFSLVIAETIRTINHLINLPEWVSMVPFPFILVCFIFLVCGFWYQQSLIKTKIGTSVRVLIAIIILAFTAILIFVLAVPIFAKGTAFSRPQQIFTMAFIIGDLFMFSGAIAISLRMWGGKLSLPWNVWSLGTIILVAYHMYYTILLMNGNNPLEYGSGILLAIGLGFLATSCEWRRSLLA